MTGHPSDAHLLAWATAIQPDDLPLDADGRMTLHPGETITNATVFLRSLRVRAYGTDGKVEGATHHASALRDARGLYEALINTTR